MKDIRIIAVFAVTLFALLSSATWAGHGQSAVTDSQYTGVDITSASCPASWTQTLYEWTLRHIGYAGIGLDNQDTQDFHIVPESNTIIGFGAALVLNGLGAAGTTYYLRRKYNRESARRFAGRHAVRLPILMDTVVSMLVLFAFSPVLLAVATISAFKSGNPKVYGRA